MPRTKESGIFKSYYEMTPDQQVAYRLGRKSIKAERDALREALELCNGDDVRLNGCACKPLSKCCLHGQIVAKALGLECSS